MIPMSRQAPPTKSASGDVPGVGGGALSEAGVDDSHCRSRRVVAGGYMTRPSRSRTINAIDTGGVLQVSRSLRTDAESCVAMRACVVRSRRDPENRGDWI